MLCVDSAAIETQIALKPFEEWKGRQELSTVSSSYCSGQLDPRKVLHGLSWSHLWYFILGSPSWDLSIGIAGYVVLSRYNGFIKYLNYYTGFLFLYQC